MYMPVATPLSTTPDTSSTMRSHMADGVGISQSAASTARPTTTTLLTVPMPGRCRSGIHSSSTTAPVAITTVPNDTGRCLATPWWNTSHGSRPSRARIISAMLVP
jgi:hypothetical protein